jgi:hypothetical protein
MKLPGSDRAVVDIAKLSDYCLNPQHPLGRHKARVFASVLGLTAAEADLLCSALLDAALEGDAMAGENDEYGQRYVVDFEMKGPRGRATVRSTWIIVRGEDHPRLTSCYVL